MKPSSGPSLKRAKKGWIDINSSLGQDFPEDQGCRRQVEIHGSKDENSHGPRGCSHPSVEGEHGVQFGIAGKDSRVQGGEIVAVRYE